MSATRTIVAALLLTALAACNRSDPPSKQLEQAVEATVEQAIDSPQQLGALPSGRFAPRDECSAVTGASGFLASLRNAVKSRDVAAMVALAADDVKLDFGSGSGSNELGRRLSGENSPLWAELDKLLTLGCASDGEAGLTLPWYFAQDIRIDDPYSTYIVTGQDVVLHNAPAGDAPEVAQISWDVVEQADDEGEFPNFLHVRWLDDRVEGGKMIDGYIERSHLRSLIDYRLIAASRNGRWRIVSLLAGD